MDALLKLLDNDARLTNEQLAVMLGCTEEEVHARIATLLEKASISLTARADTGALIGVALGITDFAYWLFITDLGVVRDWTGKGVGRALVRELHRIAGGEENIIMYTCMTKPGDVYVLNRAEWTDFTVE